MKKIFPILLIMLSIICSGCSSSKYDPTKEVTIKFVDGQFDFGDGGVTVSEYDGLTCSIKDDVGKGGVSYELALDLDATDVTTIGLNTQGILESNMDKYKDAWYYAEYQGSVYTMVKKVGDNYATCRSSPSNMSPELLVTYMYEYLSTIKLTSANTKIDYGTFVVGNDFDVIQLRTDYACIPNLIKISQDTSRDMTDSYDIVQGDKTYTLQHTATDKYEYYRTEDGFTIQVTKGADITSYITFR